MQQQAYFCFIALVLLVLPSQIQCGYSGDYRVSIWNSGPSKLGEITSFYAEVVLKPEVRMRHTANETVTFEFSWNVPAEPWIRHQQTSQRWDSFQWQWTKTGNKTVSVYVRILNNNGRDSMHERSFRFSSYSSYYASNRTTVTVTGMEATCTDKIIASLDAYQSPTAQGKGHDQNQSFSSGTVSLEVKIHNFPHQDVSNITYDWNFGDGTQLTGSHLKKLTHNFTTVKTCTVVVNLHGWIQGKFYKGAANKMLKFTVNIHPYLVMKTSAGPKLPSDQPYALPMNSPVEFEVKFKDPFNLVASISTDWKFGHDDPPVTKWQNTTIYHTFHKEGKYFLWVTIRVNTKFLGTKSFHPIGKTLYVKAPVSLEVRHRHLEHEKKTVRFNISCNGSLPVSFQLCISKQCHLPPGEMCSPTMEHSSSCSWIVNHTFSNPGNYCVNVGVMNDVSGTNTTLMIQIPATEIIASLDAYQSPTAQGKGHDQNQSFSAGTVSLEVKIHNFPHQDISNITYDWNFGDGTQLTGSRLKKLAHNFTTVKTCTVVVNLYGWIQGKFYKGAANKMLKFTVNVHPYLVMKTSAGPKLPSDQPYPLPMNIPVEFEVKFKDPFSLVASISTDWKFGDDPPVTKWKNTTIYHTFQKEGQYSLWVTIRVNTTFLGTKSFHPIEKNLYIKAPVSLEVRHRHVEHKDRTVRFNISCSGSLPVSFHWCISKQCHLPPGEMCSPTTAHSSSCSLIVNHTFSNPGNYCVNVGVMNDVSGTNTTLMIQIPGDDPGPKHGGDTTSITGILVALFIVCILLIVVIIIAARKWVYSRREKTEKADFEFRGDDALSVSSVELYGRRAWFARCGILGSRKTEERTPLCRDVPMYTL